MDALGKKWKFLSGWEGNKPQGDWPKWLISVLGNRGLKSEQEISSYLESNYEELLLPEQFLGVKEAVERIIEAKKNQEKIVVYGDYDVDGITATALMLEVLNKIGIQNVESYIPHREEEGYGLNEKAVAELEKSGTTLIVTVDCGITSKEIIEKSMIDFIVCDHHEIIPDKLPQKAIIVHPKLVKKGVEKQDFAACGMAFFLALGIQEKFPKEFPVGQEKWLLDLVALATICDVVPLIGQNRILAKWGLLVLAKTKRIGLLELMKIAGVETESLSAYSVGFLLGPRLNAAGRLDHAKKALELLLTNDKYQGIKIAVELNKLNQERQQLCERILEEAKMEIENSEKKSRLIYLLVNKDWPRGVVGIIASKLTDYYSRPVIVFEDDGQVCHGSARSIDDFDITGALGECEACLLKFGGHAKAAGLSVSTDNFEVLEEKLLKIAKDKIKEEELRPVVTIDAEIKPEEIDEKMLELISQMEPFGFGNHTPIFAILGAEIADIKRVGQKSEHLKFNLKPKERNQKEANGGVQTLVKTEKLAAIAFNNQMEINIKKKYDLAFSLRYNVWNNRKSIEMRIIDIKESG